MLRAGVIPTPAVAVLARLEGADLGCVISASHNPYRDNGIKFLRRRRPQARRRRRGGDRGACRSAPAAAGRRRRGGAADAAGALRAVAGRDLRRGLTAPASVVVDCANGAAYAAAPPRSSTRLGIPVAVRSATRRTAATSTPACGSTHLEAVAAAGARAGRDLGIAFDGDADRCLAVDAAGGR